MVVTVGAGAMAHAGLGGNGRLAPVSSNVKGLLSITGLLLPLCNDYRFIVVVYCGSFL